jgi:uncharacterized protein (DUF697 family)
MATQSDEQANSSSNSLFFWDSLSKMTVDTGNAISGAISSAGQAVVETATGTAEAVGSAATYTGQMVSDAATSTGAAVGNVLSETGQAIAGTTMGTVESVSNAANGTGQAIGGAVVGTGEAIGSVLAGTGQAAVGAANHTVEALAGAAMQIPSGVGYVLDFVSHSPQLQTLTKALKVDWLLEIINRIDVSAAETRVKQLKRQYLNENSAEIAHRIMLEKALYVGGSGLVSSLIPGAAAAMFVVDLAATTAVQAEMVYQIAAAYGLNLRDPERKGEVLAIFGLALGSNFAVEAGVGFLRNIPVAGAAIGASSNAITLYAVGYAACRFYEAKITPLNSDASIAAAQAESEKYLQEAIAQQVIMDQVLVHVILAGNPGKTWQQILPELQSLNLSPVSLRVIETNMKSPPALDSLLRQINRDFAVSLMAQCQKIVQLDGVIAPAEVRIIQTITSTLKNR